MKNLPDKLYSVDSVVQLERVAINQFGIPAYELMKRAGEAVFNVVTSRYPQHKKILVLCGAGNNAGDGYVVARLARRAGFDVRVISLIDPAALKNEALLAYQDWLSVDENTTAVISLLGEADIIIDALLGTGLKREVSAEWANWITAVNKSAKPVIAVDVPSGLIADTGVIAGSAIHADITVCFIGLKQGLFTAQANDVCGEIIFDDLALSDEVCAQVEADARLIKTVDYSLLPKRRPSSNKGNFGHVLIVGGNTGMPGAVILAAKAALRTGAGLVTIVTVASNLEAISSAVPEAMVKTCDINSLTEVFTDISVNKVTHIAIGMGLGQDDWSLELLRLCAQLDKPMLLDADALNLLAKNDIKIKSALVVTPHPGEAARLLSVASTLNSADIQHDRFSAIKQLYQLFAASESCVVILKGSGSLIFDGRTIKVCMLGNAAMAAPGMGDVLSGIVIALMAQHINISDAAELAVCLHASAARSVTQGKTRGLLASDVIDKLPGILQ
ncbi:MAG: bifunctional ADP-dependent NAD(P)H-hydrate dehydratase/NAD(P)H-hydrate epimerase [Gammaproteobacteria bacterium]|nr:MAG: bifunctional ADP-dependent NAD(P)H-hydrate dehydratase/NAD(P)H-hydrate epimerase [Gammaproteobacteria bacterium]